MTDRIHRFLVWLAFQMVPKSPVRSYEQLASIVKFPQESPDTADTARGTTRKEGS